MIEQRLPAWSHRTARRELVIDESEHTTRSSIERDSNAADAERRDGRHRPRCRPSARRCPPATVVGDVVGRVEHHHAVDRRVGRVGERPHRAARSRRADRRCASSSSRRRRVRTPPRRRRAPTRSTSPGRMSWNCCVSTSRQRSSTSAGRPSVAAHSSASTSRRSHRRLPSFVRSWLVSVPRCVSKYSSPRHTGTGAPAWISASTASKKSSGVPTASVTLRIGRRQPAGPFEHLPGRSTAAVAVPERHQRHAAPTVVLEVARRVGDLGRGDLGVVRVDGWEVGEHPGAVEALPPERAVGEPVLLVPRQLLRDEATHPARREDLRQPGRIPEHVGDPHLLATLTELLLEVPLAEHDLAHEALAGRQVHVGLDPHAADRYPLATLDPFGDAVEQRRAGAPRSTRSAGRSSRRSGTRGSRPSTRSPTRTSGRTCAASRGSATARRCRCARGRWRSRGGRPVDGRIGGIEPRLQRSRDAATTSGRRSSARFEGAQHLHPARVVEPQGAHHAVEHLEVVGERFGVGVDDDELGPAEPVDRRLAGGVERALRRRPELGERRVGGRFEQQGHVTGRVVEPVVRPPRVDALERRATHRRRCTRRAGPRTGSRPRSGGTRGRSRPRPGGPPSRRGVCRRSWNQVVAHGAPHGLPDGERFEVVEVGPGRDRQRTAVGVDEREHTLPQLALDALLDQIPVVEHDTTLSENVRRGLSPWTFADVSSSADDADVEGLLAVAAVAHLVRRRGRRCRGS